MVLHPHNIQAALGRLRRFEIVCKVKKESRREDRGESKGMGEKSECD